jgi:hypothetical protein
VARKQQKTAAAVCFHGDTWNSNAHDVGSFHPQPACLKSKMEVQWWKPRSHNCPCEHGIFFQKLESTQFLSLRYHPHGRWSQIWPLHQIRVPERVGFQVFQVFQGAWFLFG